MVGEEGEGVSIRSEMEQVFDRMQDVPSGESPAVPDAPAMESEPGQGDVEQPVGSGEPVEPAPVSTQTDGRARDEHGRFVAGDQPQEPTQTTIEADPGAQPADEPLEAHVPPAAWSAAAKDLWGTLPPAIQAEVVKRERDTDKGFAERADKLKSFEAYEQALAPVLPTLQQNFIQPAQYIQSIVQWDMALRQNPVEVGKQLIQQYGGDPSALEGTGNADFGDDFNQDIVDPSVSALKQEVEQLKALEQQRIQAAQQQQFQTIAQQIEEFRPQAPHFDAVENEMAALVHGYQAANQPIPDLQTLYDRAVWQNPETRQLVLAEQRQTEQQARQQEAKEKASMARKATETNISSSGVAAGETPKPTSMRGTMEEVFDNLQNA